MKQKAAGIFIVIHIEDILNSVTLLTGDIDSSRYSYHLLVEIHGVYDKDGYHDPDSVTLSFKLVDLETLAVDDEVYERYSEEYLFLAIRKVFCMALMDFIQLYCSPGMKGKRQYEKLCYYATRIGDELRYGL